MDKQRNKTSFNVMPAQRATEFGKDTFCVEGDLLDTAICQQTGCLDALKNN